MTDRVSGVVVTFADDIRIDDADAGVVNAIRQLRGVIDVRPVVGDDVLTESITKARIRSELLTKVIEVIREGTR